MNTEEQLAALRGRQERLAKELARTRMFSLGDAKGRTRASLYLNNGEPRLSFLDSRGKTRAAFGLDKGQSKIGL